MLPLGDSIVDTYCMSSPLKNSSCEPFLLMPGPGPTFKGYSLCGLYSLGGMTFSQLLNISATPLLWFDMFLAAIYIKTL